MGHSISSGRATRRHLGVISPVRIETEVHIERAPQEVFDYITSPSLWHTWHPATASVSDVPERPIRLGETVRERIDVGLKRFDTTWEVVECTAPKTWAISTDSGQGVALIRYEITPRATGTHFRRVIQYRSRVWPWKALDGTLMRWILKRQTRRALDQLKQVLER